MNRILYFISGIGIGVGAALLLAPQSGQDTRSTLRDSWSEGKKLLRNQAGQVRDTVSETIERGKEAARSTGQGMVDALEKGKAALRS